MSRINSINARDGDNSTFSDELKPGEQKSCFECEDARFHAANFDDRTFGKRFARRIST
jgi:hypothetical protein